MATVIDTFGASRRSPSTGIRRPGRPRSSWRTKPCSRHGLGSIDGSTRRGTTCARSIGGRGGAGLERGRPGPVLPAVRVASRAGRGVAGGIRSRPDTQESTYLVASVAERDRKRTDEEVRQARERDLERRSVRRLRTVVAVLTVAALVAGVLTVFATNQQGRAEQRSGPRSLASSRLHPSRTSTSILSGASCWRSRRSIGHVPSTAPCYRKPRRRSIRPSQLHGSSSRLRAPAATSTGVRRGRS